MLTRLGLRAGLRARPGARTATTAPRAPARRHLLTRGAFGSVGPPPDLPPISARLRPLVPFLIMWTIITSLALHLLRARKRAEAGDARAAAQESVLRGLVARFERGDVVPDSEIRRELEMVGLRPRTAVSAGEPGLEELRDTSWFEVLLGRREHKAARAAQVAAQEAQERERAIKAGEVVGRAGKRDAAVVDDARDAKAAKAEAKAADDAAADEAVQEWAKIVEEATAPAQPAPERPQRVGVVKRAESASAFL